MSVIFSDLSSQLSDHDHPDHRIYRKSTIRFSLVQRFRAIISEEQRRSGKMPTYKQGSKSMGAKIAQPDYADPQKLFRSTQTLAAEEKFSSTQTLAVEEKSNFETLDLSINEKEVLSCGDRVSLEFEKRLHSSSQDVLNSSQNSDSYYERLMEKNLNDFDANTPNPAAGLQRLEGETKDSEPVQHKDRRYVKRPTKAPPPIPSKPARLLTTNSSSFSENCSATNGNTITACDNKFNKSATKPLAPSPPRRIEGAAIKTTTSSKGWVKTVVGRFE